MNTISSAPNATHVDAGHRSDSTSVKRGGKHHFAHHVIICCPQNFSTDLGPILAAFILDGVRQIHLAGPAGGQVKSMIGAILARGGFKVPLNITWYEDETLESVISFARSYCHSSPGGTQVVHL